MLTSEECASPLGRRVYDCRHTCLTGWLNAGVPLAWVAEWVESSGPILPATYARVISGQATDIQRRIESLVDVSSYYRPDDHGQRTSARILRSHLQLLGVSRTRRSRLRP